MIEELKDNQGIDLNKLQYLLVKGKWKEADKETTRLMFQLANKDGKEFLNEEDCKNFPQEELQAIDKLWLDNSEGKFGFSVQKQIYLEIGGKLNEYDKESYLRICDCIGWSKNYESPSYPYFNFDLQTAPQGYFPMTFAYSSNIWATSVGFVSLSCVERPDYKNGNIISYLFSRL